MEPERKLFICECGSIEHQLLFWYDKEEKTLYTEVHLITWHKFFKRLWYGLKYAFGYKCRFGAWDEFMFNPEQIEQLNKYLKNVL
jgi:hypothetical protein